MVRFHQVAHLQASPSPSTPPSPIKADPKNGETGNNSQRADEEDKQRGDSKEVGHQPNPDHSVPRPSHDETPNNETLNNETPQEEEKPAGKTFAAVLSPFSSEVLLQPSDSSDSDDDVVLLVESDPEGDDSRGNPEQPDSRGDDDDDDDRMAAAAARNESILRSIQHHHNRSYDVSTVSPPHHQSSLSANLPLRLPPESPRLPPPPPPFDSPFLHQTKQFGNETPIIGEFHRGIRAQVAEPEQFKRGLNEWMNASIGRAIPRAEKR